MHARTLIFFALLLSLPLGGCQLLGDLDDDASPTDVLWPLAVGNTWTYALERQTDGPVELDTVDVEVVGTRTVTYAGAAVETHIVRTTYRRSLVLTTDQLLRNEADGVYRYIEDWHAGDAEPTTFRQLRLRYPTEAGNTWEVEHGDYSDTYVTVTTDTTITTPLGAFDALLVRNGTGTTWTNDEFYRPGLGLVAQIGRTLVGPAEHVTRQTLIAYDLQP